MNLLTISRLFLPYELIAIKLVFIAFACVE